MFRWLVPCLIAILTTACGDFDFKVNERVVFSPRPLFSEFEISDEALRTCITQAIADNTVTAAAQLQQLNCSSAGIEKLDGLATFTGLTHLNLASNAIRNLADLGALSALQVLALNDNDIVDPVPLYQLNALQQLNLTDNSRLQCPANSAFAIVEKVSLPGHCQP